MTFDWNLSHMSDAAGYPRYFIQYSQFLTARCHVFTPDSSSSSNLLSSTFSKDACEKIYPGVIKIRQSDLNVHYPQNDIQPSKTEVHPVMGGL